ncbi:hypothetical protein MLD38_007923 [Melastoma candidum]|nr:hypothetical protein MLD38_007923 [Melastoma candidum]
MAAKKVWNVLRVFYFMLRKEISRRKLMSELNLVMKRGKIAGKAISGLMNFSHHGSHGSGFHNNDRDRAAPSASPASGEYEFSCSNSPVTGGHSHPSNYLNTHFFSSRNHFHGFFGCAHLPKTAGDEDTAAAEDVAPFGDAVVMAMIEVEETDQVSEVASPMLPGFGRTPLARQLRITDSPFPLKDDGDGGKVDKAAEEFIQKFYRALQKQKSG